MKAKLDFTKDKLRVIVLELAHNNGYEKPSPYLDELLNQVKEFKDINFECTFYLNIHCLCKENASAFRVPSHRDDITKWLCKSPIGKKIFPKTWDGIPLPMRLQSKPTETNTESQTQEPTEITSPISRTKQIISKYLEGMDKHGWEYAFRNESDYNNFLELLTNHFEYKPYSLPKGVIKLKKGCQTKFAKALKHIHKDVSEHALKSDDKYFRIIKTLNHFQNRSFDEIYIMMMR